MPPFLDPATEDARTILRWFLIWLGITTLGVAIIAAC